MDVRRIMVVGFFVLGLSRLAAGPVPETAVAWHTSPQASVLICGGTMMNGAHFSDSVLPAMRAHYAGCRRIALILHASPPAERDSMEQRLQTAFAHLGVPVAESVHHFDDAGARELLAKVDGFFVGGGETFVLLRELYRTGQLEQIRARVLAGAVYGGASAGANVAGLIIGTTNDFPVADVPSRAAFGLLPVTINPHLPTVEQKGEFDARVGKIRAYLKFNPAETVLGVGNASIVRLHAGRAELAAGYGWIFRAGSTRELKVGAEIPELTPATR